MKRQSIFVWGISILSILILAALILVNRQQNFSFYESKDAHKKESLIQNQLTENLTLENSGQNLEPLTFPLEDDVLTQLFNTEKEMYINASSLNLRSGPSTDFDVVKTLFQNDSVIVGSTITFDQFDYGDGEVEWVAIKVDDAIGFVNPHYLIENLTAEEETELNDTDNKTSSNPLSSPADTAVKPNKKPTTTESSNNATSSGSEQNDDSAPANDNETSGVQLGTDDNANEEDDETPRVTTKTDTETEVIYHKVIEIENPDLLEGTVELVTEGVNGILTITYKKTYEGDELVKIEEVNRKITKEKKDKVVHIGTKPASTEE
ncbi:G5 domain-containing protein [Halolactibacillus halophilus]|uniref:G5 domain-containing protein n=1 Tax=Halolactibacillus halophilus TaxID=306540 RepID=A0A1I5RDR7_9BACI|nr:G5 domain-containing protein [Halolactibacillus halophilus]GEM02180.1 hypothetical protein HHA03_17120 [Halolactibacillus halophilus]SFP56605.1 G5 domain-containing protein [Halolactibacillus halophilus]